MRQAKAPFIQLAPINVAPYNGPMRVHDLVLSMLLAGLDVGTSADKSVPTLATNLAPLPLKLSPPSNKGIFVEDLSNDPHVEPHRTTPRPPFLAPAGVTNSRSTGPSPAAPRTLRPRLSPNLGTGKRNPSKPT